MTDQEVRQHLEAFRSGRLAADDPVVTEALQRATSDPELTRWWRQRRTLAGEDRFAPSPGDDEQVLNEEETPEAAPAASSPAPRRKAMSLLALLASLVLVAVVAREWRTPDSPIDFTAYRVQMLERMEASDLELEVYEADLVRLQEELGQREAPVPQQFTDGLRRAQATGCRTFEWQGRKISLIAFLAQGQQARLFVTRRAGLVGAPSGGKPAPTQVGAWATASWADDDLVYVVATRGTVAQLAPFL